MQSLLQCTPLWHLCQDVSWLLGHLVQREPSGLEYQHILIYIHGCEVECVSTFKFLGVHISENLSWSTNVSELIKKAQQWLYFLRTLKKAQLSLRILMSFYRCSFESILTHCITVWYGNCSVVDRKALQQVVKTPKTSIGNNVCRGHRASSRTPHTPIMDCS